MSKQSSRGTKWERTRLAVLERDGHLCNYCGRDATTADHVIPKAAGGTDDMSNLVAACLTCNGRKSDRMLVRLDYVNPRWLTRV